MTIHYLDPSAWVRRYLNEPGSGAVNALFRSAPTAACCRLGLTEMTATVVRKCQGASVAATIRDQILARVRTDFGLFRVVSVDEPVIAEAERLVLVHRLRTMDAVHLACALSVGPASGTVLVSADLELLAAAGLEGLTPLNP